MAARNSDSQKLDIALSCILKGMGGARRNINEITVARSVGFVADPDGQLAADDVEVLRLRVAVRGRTRAGRTDQVCNGTGSTRFGPADQRGDCDAKNIQRDDRVSTDDD